MGQVYRAYDLELGQPVALKFLSTFRADSRARARLRTEVRLARQISHPHVCRVYDIGEADGELYLSMEYVDGEDLATSLKRVGRVPPLDAIEIARGICTGLAAAHAKGVLHRDLKPGNIMLDTRGEVRIMDFGLAATPAQLLDAADVRSGTPAYMAPEQLEGRAATPCSDIYALGLVLFELFTRRQPFDGRSADDFLRVRRTLPSAAPSTLVPGLDPAIDRTILRCLEPDPGMRPASALKVETSLRESGSAPDVGRDLAPTYKRDASVGPSMTLRRTGSPEIGELVLPSSTSVGARRIWIGLRSHYLWAGAAARGNRPHRHWRRLAMVGVRELQRSHGSLVQRAGAALDAGWQGDAGHNFSRWAVSGLCPRQRAGYPSATYPERSLPPKRDDHHGAIAGRGRAASARPARG